MNAYRTRTLSCQFLCFAAVGLALALVACGEEADDPNYDGAGGSGAAAAGGAGSGGTSTGGGSGGTGDAGSSTGGTGDTGGSSTGGTGDTGGSSTGGTGDTGGTGGDGGSSGSPSAGGTGGTSGNPCDDPGLVWKDANKTNYESYPDPESEECVEYNGCEWAGQFAYCDDERSEAWVEAHNIAAVFPSNGLVRHDLCLRSGTKTFVVTAIDTCGDSDCDGCCTENLGDADRLIDLEKFTNERWGVPDGPIEWADLGENPNACD